MANRVPLIVDTSTLNIKELPASDNLDLTSSGLLGVTKIGINTAATKNTLEVIGNANVTGVLTASSFVGNITGNIVGNVTGSATGLTGTPDIIVRNISATGITTYEDVRNVDSIGVITARTDAHVGAGLSVIGISTFGNNTYQGSGVYSYYGSGTSNGAIGYNGSNLLIQNNTDIILRYGNNTKFQTTSTGVNVTGVTVDDGATHAGDVTFDNGTNAGKDIVWDESDNQLEFSDDVKASFGGGNDLQIYHQSSNNHSYIKEAGSGSLVVLADDLYIQDTSTNTMIKATEGGNVELSHNGTKTFETTNLGAKVTGGLEVTGVSTCTGNIDANGNLDVAGTSVFNNDVTLPGTNKNIVWDKSDQQLEINGDNSNVAKIAFGDSHDFQIYKGASGGNAFLHNASGTLYITQNSGTIRIDKNTGDEMAHFNVDGSVQLFHNSLERITTTADGADISGTGSLKIPVGTTGQRSGSPTNGDFRYNTTDDQFEGYSDGAWGAIGGGASETDTSVSSTSATAVYTVAHATYRSASLLLQITQGSAYQSGRYMVIHDGTTATIVEESAVATGSMLGTFTAGIDGSNLKVYVNMGSSSSATVTVIPTPVTV